MAPFRAHAAVAVTDAVAVAAANAASDIVAA